MFDSLARSFKKYTIPPPRIFILEPVKISLEITIATPITLHIRYGYKSLLTVLITKCFTSANDLLSFEK